MRIPHVKRSLWGSDDSYWLICCMLFYFFTYCVCYFTFLHIFFFHVISAAPKTKIFLEKSNTYEVKIGNFWNLCFFRCKTFAVFPTRSLLSGYFFLFQLQISLTSSETQVSGFGLALFLLHKTIPGSPYLSFKTKGTANFQ